MEHPEYVQLYGGILAKAASDHAEEEASVPNQASKPRRTRRKKMTPRSPSNDDEEKRGKRGRPRVEPLDQSAVERRRTQIRLAQRAYRERKETTISVLENRVAHLQQTVNHMNQTFLEFNDKTISSGIIKTNSSLGEDLKTTMLRFLELAREAASEGDLEAPVQNTSQTQEDSPPTISELRPTRAKPRRAIRSTSIQSVSSPEILNHPASMMGYAVSYDDEDTAQDPDDGDIEIVEQLENYGSNDFDTMWDNGSAIIQQYHAKIPEIPASPQKWDAAADMALKTTYTYSFQEKSFGRRLLRASYEAAYHYLTNPDSRVHDVEYKLRYSLCIAGDKNRVIARIHDILTRSSNQSLEHWDTPMRHIGGSGLHYPRSNLREDTPPDDWASTQAVGPFKPRNALMGIPDRDYPQNLLKIANVEGPWFDSNDVEHYLRTKGLFLDGHTSIAEIEVDEAVPGLTGSFAAGSPTSTFSDSFGDSHSDPQSPRQGNDIASTYSLPPGDYFSEVQTRHNVSPMQPIMDFHSMSVDSDITAGWPEDGTFKAADMLGVNQPAMFSELETFDYVQPRRKLTIDVDKLLEGLIEKSICLGRAPGYRQSDVDDVLARVMQEAL